MAFSNSKPGETFIKKKSRAHKKNVLCQFYIKKIILKLFVNRDSRLHNGNN